MAKAPRTTTETAETERKEPEAPHDSPAVETPQENATVTAENMELLFSLSELAARHRLPSWQVAALNRLMGWEDGKKVSEAEYAVALGGLKNRRIGG